MLFGCVVAALLALAADSILAFFERMIARPSRPRAIAAATGLVLILAAGGLSPFLGAQAQYVIGAKGFPEQYVLASLIDQRLGAAGLKSVTRSNLGSAVIFNALVAGDVDAYVDYSGTIWTNFMHRADTPSRDIVLREMSAWLKGTYGVTMLGPLGFENAYVLAMRRDRAASLGIHSIEELAAASPRLAVGGDYEIFARPEWKALRNAYGLAFRQERQMQPIFMYKAVVDGEVDAITAFSSDGRIAELDLLTLGDPKQAIPPYDAVLLIAPRRSADAAFIAAVKPLIGRISILRMREANLLVSREEGQAPPEDAARRLWQEIAGQ